MSDKAVLWDLDGTLVDSEEFHWLSWRDTMRAEGVELTYPQFLASFGQRNDRIVPAWLGPGVDVWRTQPHPRGRRKPRTAGWRKRAA